MHLSALLDRIAACCVLDLSDCKVVREEGENVGEWSDRLRRHSVGKKILTLRQLLALECLVAVYDARHPDDYLEDDDISVQDLVRRVINEADPELHFLQHAERLGDAFEEYINNLSEPERVVPLQLLRALRTGVPVLERRKFRANHSEISGKTKNDYLRTIGALCSLILGGRTEKFHSDARKILEKLDLIGERPVTEKTLAKYLEEIAWLPKAKKIS